jgi:hypothetical protein
MADVMEQQKPRRLSQVLAVIAAVGAGIMRLFPYIWNFTPLNALSIFGGARLPLWQAFMFPVGVMAVTDTLIWTTKGWKPNLIVYGSFMLSVLLGRLLRRTSSPVLIGVCTLVVSVQFFLITNFSVWAGSRVDPASIPDGDGYVTSMSESPYSYPIIHYANSPKGLAACYWLAAAFTRPEAPPLGFFGNLVLGDLFFVALLFGAHALALRVLTRGKTIPVGWTPH